jgi:hypothetical protein
MKEYLENILKGLLAGLLSAYLIIYALRPAVPYPELVLEIFENKWMFLILLIINYYIFIWDYHSGAILLLCTIALAFDYIVFTEKGFKKVVKVESFSNKMLQDMVQQPIEETQENEKREQDPILKKLLQIQGTNLL